MIATVTCNTCGTSLDAARNGGRCARCLFAAAFDVPDEGGGLGTIGGHVLIEEIARGGMGVVYRARQPEPERVVALKTMRGADLDSLEALERFRHEARAMAGLEHAAILPVFTFGEHDGIPYFTMKLASGGTLTQRLAGYAGKWREIAELVAKVADAVQHAHTHAVLHRDLKPGNILFDESGHAFVSDFGIAKLIDEKGADLTLTAAVLGTPHYLAPEIATRDARAATTASDVWSLGVILYELLAQRRPFEGDSISSLLRAISETEPAALRTVPRDLAVIVMKALAKESARRYLTAAALAQDLRRWLAGSPIEARPVSAPEKMWLWARRKPGFAALSAALLLAVVVSAVLLIVAYRDADSERRNARESLRASLITQARLEMATGRAGQRYDAIETLQRAAAIRPGEELASEFAAALARPDLRATAAAWHFDRVTDADRPEFSPDLAQCAVPEKAGGFSLRTTGDGKIIRRFPAGVPAASFAFSPDGRTIAVRLTSNVLQLWPIEGTAPLAEIPCSLVAGMGDAMPASFSSSLDAWAVVAPDGAVLKVTAKGEVSPWLPAGGRVGGSAGFDPAGERLALVHRDGVELWQMRDGRKLWELKVTRPHAALAWHPTGHFLAVNEGIGSPEVVVIRASDGTIRARLAGSLRLLSRLAFHPTAAILAGCAHGTLYFWDFRDGARLLTAPATDLALRWSADGTRLGSGKDRESLGILEFAPDTVFREFAGNINTDRGGGIDLTATPDDRALIHVGGSIVTIWSTQARGRLGGFANDKTGSLRPFVTPDGRSVAFTKKDTGIVRRSITSPFGFGFILGDETVIPDTAQITTTGTTPDGRWLVFHRDTRRWEAWPGGDRTRATHLMENGNEWQVFSPDLRWSVSSTVREKVDAFDLAAGGRPFDLPLKNIQILVFSPDGRWLLASSKEGDTLLETGTWRIVARWDHSGTGFETVRGAFSGDSRHLAVSRTGEAIEILSVPDLKLDLTLSPPRPLGFFRLVFSRDGTRLWATGLGLRLYEWNLADLANEMTARRLPVPPSVPGK